jgi:hypothetical protein
MRVEKRAQGQRQAVLRRDCDLAVAEAFDDAMPRILARVASKIRAAVRGGSALRTFNELSA